MTNAVRNFAINSIYLATEGEGIHLGSPQIFVRFQGCNIGCVNCDSLETWEFIKENYKTLEEVIDQIYESGKGGLIKRVSITGGDPLHPSHVPAVVQLCHTLKELNFYINIEASGQRIVPEIFDIVDFISFDFKTPSTNVKGRPELIEQMHKKYNGKFQVKAVIENDRDFSSVFDAYKDISDKDLVAGNSWCLTPAYNPAEDFPIDRYLEVIGLNESVGGVFRVIGQQHKMLHGPNKKNI
jgi:7-carboxy-7-deazaguanine synthase